MLVWHAAEKRAEAVVENGLILEAFQGNEYTTRIMPLESGDRCLLYTDGLTEAPNAAGEEFGVERLLEFLRDNAALTPEKFCDVLLARVDTWCGRRPGQEPADDLTLLLVEFSG